MTTFLVLVEEYDCEEVKRDLQMFQSIEDYYAYLQKCVFNIRSEIWPSNQIPPLCPSLSEATSISVDTVESVYVFEYETSYGDFFSFEIFVKRI